MTDQPTTDSDRSTDAPPRSGAHGTAPGTAPETAPGERRLARPPSERFAAAVSGATTTEAKSPAGSPIRALAFSTMAALAGVVATVVLGGALAFSAGLLVVAAAMGRAVGLATAVGARDTIAPRARIALAVTVAVLGVAVGQVGLWLYARAEGGVLSLPDYLLQTFGVLVPAQFALAAAVAWWSAR